MALRETIATFLAAQLDFIFFLYGLAFLFLGTVCFAVGRMREPGSAWKPLGLFGFFHGAGEWLDLSALGVTDTATFALIRTMAMTASFLFLLEFARQKAIRFGLKPLEGPPLYTALILMVMLGGIVGGVPMAGAYARYGIGFFAAVAAASVFVAHARGFSGTARGLALVTAAGFALYGVAAGAVVPAAPFWPASVFNQAWFFQVTGIPIQLVRGLLACVLALSVWMIWGQLLIAEISSERYAAYLRRQFVWTLAAIMTFLACGWVLTDFLGAAYKRDIQKQAQGDINLIASRFAGEAAIVNGTVKALAESPSVLPLLTGGSGQDERRARTVLDLGVEASGARFGAILDISGTLVAASDPVDAADVSKWSAAPWFQKALAGQAGYHFAFDPADRGRYYYASYPVRRDDGSIAGVAFLQKSLDRLDADLRLFVRPNFFVNPDGIVVLTNRPDMMLRALWPLPAEARSTLIRQFGTLDDRAVVEREIKDGSWVLFNGERDLVRRSSIEHSQWSVILAMPGARIYAGRMLGIVATLLMTLMVLIYFFGREYGIRDRIQMNKRVELQELAQNLRLRATTDPLTGLYNRAKFDESLASETARSERYKTPLALIMYDVDHFKQVNDVHGHQTGDDVLVRLSEIVFECIRTTDLLARWGGEEFVILAPGLDGEAAYQAAEKLRAAIEQATFSVAGKITCSFGVAEFSEGDSAATLVARADDALYRAKMRGRNRTELVSRSDSIRGGMASVA
ncbi:diguanylate cyclase [Bradyrhizobium sediminis]|uniref:diguanylate cyclase n=1 Tax=Bradyrhizobium sediminis TaxID=2840469 RepID=A0A975NPX8_9BRAD|nr:sensor domain-containing diguanylate cyclase [Bradyrhizobium sediminis]QWG17944.1 diguanylate cyclase [Bradyrhizobium sediminis]